MKLLFIHDHPFYMEEKAVYSGGGLPYFTWSNYLVNFNEVVVYGRYSHNFKDKKVKSSTDKVSFHLTKNYSTVLTLFKNKKKLEQELVPLINKADVVLVRLPSVLGFIAGNMALKSNKPLWVEQVGNAKEALGSHGSLLGKIAAPVFEFQNKKITKQANFLSYVTAHKLQKDYPANPKAITVGISDVIINDVIDEKVLNGERFSAGVFKVGLIGGFDAKYKGQDVLLKAIASLEDDIKNHIQISLIGKGNSTWVLELAKGLNLQDHIEYMGPLESGEQINTFLKKLSLYVQPSLTEGMPRAAIEAMAMGCPVIGSNVGGIPDIVSKQYVHKKGDVKELANHIKTLYLNRESLREEAVLSLKKAMPYQKENLDKKRLEFYARMNKELVR
ncbi:glycosyltransferase [Tenacibaculum sp. IB213877]|uniref:glycosyltransferase n=1 Tax=Tenacibaculum sp. IB213877 TaxID=3097351 RepID=UPI002A5AB9B1|nr:glycosyltransferase [Tenacibaculum sp. IB213877]MDY0781371.1 glycosyltransferase [Tenacibaculum sp. IB213877]